MDLLNHLHLLISITISIGIVLIVLCDADADSPRYETYCSHEMQVDADAASHSAADLQKLGAPAGDQEHGQGFNFAFHNGYFSGGSPLFSYGTATPDISLGHGNNAFFTPRNVSVISRVQGLGFSIEVEGSLSLQSQSGSRRNTTTTTTRVFRSGFGGGRRTQPLFLQSAGSIRIRLRGIWLLNSSTLCMAGCFREDRIHHRKDCKVKAIIHYPSEGNTVKQPFLTGKLESKREVNDPLFFQPIIIIATPENPFVFTTSDSAGKCLYSPDVGEGINVWKDASAMCHFPWYKQPLDVVWKHAQGSSNAVSWSPFEGMAASHEGTVSVQNMICEEGKVHGLFIFSYKVNGAIVASEVLSVEGIWNVATGQLCASACYLKGASNGSLEYDSKDCDIIITLQFPTTLDLLFRYSVIGHVKRKENSEFSFFNPFQFTGHMDITYGALGWMISPPQLEYSYSVDRIKQAQSMCQQENTGGWLTRSMKKTSKLKYPNGHIFSDLGFSATVMDLSEGMVGLYFSPIAINERTSRNFYRGMAILTSPVALGIGQSMNISFEVSLELNQRSNKLFPNTSSMRFSAEGLYNWKTGMLCLIACRRVEELIHGMSKLDDGNKDCQIHIAVQYPPTNPGYFGKRRITGKIISLREQNEQLYFSPKSLTSDLIFYKEQAANALIQIDVEIIMRVVSLTMAALFVVLQLRHVKKNPKVLPHVSLLMLSLLTLGYLIPLILNFEAIFSSTSKQNILQSSGGWLEMNEVIVRLMTMLAFLLLLRLLHLAWAGKCEFYSEGPWYSEQGACWICGVCYAIVGLIASIVYGVGGSKTLDVSKAFAGLTVDFFLFPQIIGNYVWDVRDAALSPPFYCGMTFVRLLPHLYDIVRKFEFFSLKSRRYYYASPSWNFYSISWDAVIPCGSLLCALLIFLQQRYGGAFLWIPFWRRRISYEIVSPDSL